MGEERELLGKKYATASDYGSKHEYLLARSQYYRHIASCPTCKEKGNE